jgi:four helix bundle protein
MSEVSAFLRPSTVWSSRRGSLRARLSGGRTSSNLRPAGLIVEYAFDHENLDVYRLALEVARGCPARTIATGRSPLRDQLQRAADSAVPNIAEGRSRGGDLGRDHYRIGAGSAAEACAALDLVATPEALPLQPKLRRVGAMLRGLAR